MTNINVMFHSLLFKKILYILAEVGWGIEIALGVTSGAWVVVWVVLRYFWVALGWGQHKNTGGKLV